jgi:uncharacterized protein YjbJ (UPF0337 family)
MDWNVVASEWKQFRGEVRTNWRKLTTEELEAIAGNRICLANTIRESYRLTSEEAEQQISSFEARSAYFRTVSSR